MDFIFRTRVRLLAEAPATQSILGAPPSTQRFNLPPRCLLPQQRFGLFVYVFRTIVYLTRPPLL
jgi:hypothetical protein